MASLIERINNHNAPRPPQKSWGLAPYWINSVSGRSGDLTHDKAGAVAAYAYVGHVHSATQICVNAATALNWSIYRYNSADPEQGVELASSRDVTVRHPLQAAMLDYRKRSGVGFLRRVFFSWTLFDAVFVERLKNEYGFVRGLEWLNPLSVEFDTHMGGDQRGQIRLYRYSDQYGGYDSYTPDQIAYGHGENPLDDLRGYSRLMAAMDAVNIDRNMKRAILAHFRNGLQPGMILAPKDGTRYTPAELETIREQLSSQAKGVDQTGNAIRLPAAMEVTPYPAPDYGKLYELQDRIQREIYNALGVPIAMAGNSDLTTYKDGDEVTDRFYLQRVLPDVREIETFINLQLMPHFTDANERLLFDTSAFDRQSVAAQQRAEQARVDFQSGAITLNAYLTRTNQPPVENGDVYFVPAGFQVVPAQGLHAATPPPAPAPAPMYPIRDAPPQTTFSRVTYNGVTVLASPVQPSDRDDKKYMRWVKRNADDPARIVHWGQPGEQMERDNPDARENFNSRHNCDAKRDPFSAGFWACWHWQPDAKFDTSGTIDKAHNDLKRWQRKAKGALKNGAVHANVEFASDAIPALLASQITGALLTASDRETVEAIFDEAHEQVSHHA